MSRTNRIGLGVGVLLDPANECLVVNGLAVPLRPKVYGVLRYLVENPDRIVTKDEILDRVWLGSVVGDSVLKVCIRELRTALGDSTKEPRFVETVHRRGYRYIGAADPVGGDAPKPPAVELHLDAPAQAPASRFVARAPEIAHLKQALAMAREGQRSTVFISGPAGIGKTALVDETLRQFALHDHVRVVRGRCQGTSGTKEPYLPFLECVRELAGDQGRVEQLRRVAPTWFVQFPWLLQDEDRTSLIRELQGATESRMSRELDVFLGDASREEIIVLVLEDLHWSDPSSVSLLSFLATRDTPTRMLTIATSRPIELIVNEHPLRHVKRELTLRDRCSELHLELLAPDEVDEIVTKRFAGSNVAPEVSPWIHSRTEGHPLFVMHLLEHLVATGHLALASAQWALTTDRSILADAMPSSLPDIVHKTLGRCDPDERAALEAAALAGQEFSAHAVAHATDFDVQRAEELCDGLASRGDFLDAVGVAQLPGGIVTAKFRFTHALLRDSLSGSISPSRRVRCQRRLAERGEALYGEQAHEIAAHLALHFEEAWMHERAIHYHRLAADNARRRFSNGVALEHLFAAHALLVDGDAQAPELGSDLQYEIARTLRASGDVLRAAEVYESLASAAATPAEASEAWLLAAGARSWHGRSDCMANVDGALALIEQIDDPSTAAHIRGSAAYWKLLWEGWEPGGKEAVEEALRLAMECGRAEHIAAHRARLAFFLALEGEYDKSASTAALAHAEALALSDSSECLLAHFYRGLALHLGSRFGDAKGHMTRARDEAFRNGHVPWGVLFDIQLAWLAVESGDRAARSLAQSSVHAAASLEHDFVSGFANVVAALAAVAEGDEADARALIAKATSTPYLMNWLCGLIALTGRSRLGEADAQRELHETASRMGADQFRKWSHPE